MSAWFQNPKLAIYGRTFSKSVCLCMSKTTGDSALLGEPHMLPKAGLAHELKCPEQYEVGKIHETTVDLHVSTL